MANDIEVVVPTSVLQKLLADQPEIGIKLTSMACEKIAEEMFRKIDKWAVMKGEGEASRVIQNVLAAATAQLKNQWTFPAAGREIVNALATKAVEAEFHTRRAEFRGLIDDDIARPVAAAKKDIDVYRDAAIGQIGQEVEAFVRKIARDEFLSVMAEVKKGLG